MEIDQVIIGVDPHKLSVTFEARDNREILRATGRFGTDAGGYRLLLIVCAAVARAGVGGGGRERERAAAGTAAARQRGAGRRCPGEAGRPGPAVRSPGTAARPMPTDAHAVVMVALRDKKLRVLRRDGELEGAAVAV